MTDMLKESGVHWWRSDMTIHWLSTELLSSSWMRPVALTTSAQVISSQATKDQANKGPIAKNTFPILRITTLSKWKAHGG